MKKLSLSLSLSLSYSSSRFLSIFRSLGLWLCLPLSTFEQRSGLFRAPHQTFRRKDNSLRRAGPPPRSDIPGLSQMLLQIAVGCYLPRSLEQASILIKFSDTSGLQGVLPRSPDVVPIVCCCIHRPDLQLTVADRVLLSSSPRSSAHGCRVQCCLDASATTRNSQPQLARFHHGKGHGQSETSGQGPLCRQR